MASFRPIARASATSGNSPTTVNASSRLSLIGPTLLLPPLTPTQALHIISVMAWADDPNNANALILADMNISIALAQTNPAGPLVATRVRHYVSPSSFSQVIGSVGLRFGYYDLNPILGTDYREISIANPPATIGAFCISVETEIINNLAVAQTLQGGITVQYEILEGAGFGG